MRWGWVVRIPNDASGSSLPASVSGHITSFLSLICMLDQPHFAARDDSSKPVPSTNSRMTIGRLLKKVNKRARNL